MYKLYCLHCGKNFESKHRLQKFCNNQCKHIYSRLIKEKICPVCNKVFRGARSQKTCSLRCRGIQHRVKPKKCKVCSRNFEPVYRLQKHCSKECSMKARKTLKEKICPVCNKRFYGKNFLQKFCSLMCAWENQRTKKRNCKGCGAEFTSYKKSQKYCSKKCSYENRKAGRRRKKISVKYLDNIWARAIKKKSVYKCEYCLKEGKYLNAHHIFSRSNYRVRWDLENGILLCPLHHLLGIFSAHKAPLEFYEWLKEKRGTEWFDNLRKKAYHPLTNGMIKKDREEILNKLNEFLGIQSGI